MNSFLLMTGSGPLMILTSHDSMEDADLLVVDGRIAAVGRNLRVPSGAREIDGTGKHLTAGMIDEHSHIAISRGVNEGSHAVTSEVRIEVEGERKPACVAETIGMYFFDED